MAKLSNIFNLSSENFKVCESEDKTMANTLFQTLRQKLIELEQDFNSVVEENDVIKLELMLSKGSVERLGYSNSGLERENSELQKQNLNLSQRIVDLSQYFEARMQQINQLTDVNHSPIKRIKMDEEPTISVSTTSASAISAPAFSASAISASAINAPSTSTSARTCY